MEGQAFDPDQGCSVTIKNFSFTVKNNTDDHKTILSNINIATKPGELLAILGPSGCGKTTLLNCIAMRTKGHMSGEILFNGRSMTRNELLNEELLSYVMSKDRHLEFLTVKESLKYAARLKMPDHTEEERQNRITALAIAMDLHTSFDTLVGGVWSKGLSTGEMRRLSIAIELLDNPSILLLDEPTTGLDSTRAAALIPVLKQLAIESKKNVMMTIHQPSSDVFANFDKILIMSKGRVICGGPAAAAMSYVNSRFLQQGMTLMLKPCNPADFLLDLVSAVPESKKSDPRDTRIRLTEDQLDEWASYYRNGDVVQGMIQFHEESKAKPMKLRGLRASTCHRWWNAFSVLYCRMSLNSIRNPMETVILAGAQLLLTGWLGLIFYQSCGEPKAADYSPTFNYLLDVVQYVTGSHAIEGGFADMKNWSAMHPDGTLLDPVTPINALLDDATIAGYDYTVTDYGTGITPDPSPVKKLTSPDVEYDLFDFPISIPTTVESGHEFVSCIRNKMGSIPNLDYAQLFSQERYRHWDFNDVPQNVLDAIGNDADIELARTKWNLIYRVISLGDFAFNHISWDDLPDYDLYDQNGNMSPWIRTAHGTFAKESPTAVGVPYWLKVMACYGDELNAMLGCMNFPALPNLRDHSLISLLGLDVSCVKPDTSATMRQKFGRQLSKMEGFDTYHSTSISEPRRLTEHTPDATNQQWSKDIEVWIGEIMRIGGECDHPLCKSATELLGNLSSDIGAQAIPIFKELHIGGMMMFLAGFLQFASFDAILTFQQDRVIFNRETNNQMYPTSAFFIAKNCAALPFQYFHTSVGFIVLYFLSGIEINLFWHFYAMGVSTIWAMYGFNFFFSACSKTLEMAIYLVPCMVITMLVTCGFFVRESTFPAWVGWMKYFSCTRWAFHGFCLLYFPRGGTWGGLPNSVALGLYGTSSPDAQTCFMALGMIGLLYRIVGFAALKYLHRSVGLES